MKKTTITFQITVEQLDGATVASIYSTMDGWGYPRRAYETVNKTAALHWVERELADMIYQYRRDAQ